MMETINKENVQSNTNVTNNRRRRMKATPTKSNGGVINSGIQKSPHVTPGVKRSKRIRGRKKQLRQINSPKPKRKRIQKANKNELLLEAEKMKEKTGQNEKRMQELSEENKKLKAKVESLEIEKQSNMLNVANLGSQVVSFHKSLCADLLKHGSTMGDLSWTWKELAKQKISARDSIDMEAMEAHLTTPPNSAAIDQVLEALKEVEKSSKPESSAYKEMVTTLIGRFSEAKQVLNQFPLKDHEVGAAVIEDFVTPLDQVLSAPHMQIIQEARDKYNDVVQQAAKLKEQVSTLDTVNDDPKSVVNKKDHYFNALEAVVAAGLSTLGALHQKGAFNTNKIDSQLPLQCGAKIVSGLISGYASLQEKCRLQLAEIEAACLETRATHEQRMNEYKFKKNEYSDFLKDDDAERKDIAEQLGKLFEREVDRRHRFMERQKNDRLQDLQKQARNERLNTWNNDANICKQTVQATLDLNKHGENIGLHVQESMQYATTQLTEILQSDNKQLAQLRDTFEKELVQCVNKLYTSISLEEWRTWESIRSYRQDIKKCNIDVKKFTMLGQSKKIEAARNESKKVKEALEKEQRICDAFRLRREKIVTPVIKQIFDDVRARAPELGIDKPQQTAAKAVYHEKLVLAELTSESSHIGSFSMQTPSEVQARMQTDMEPLEAMFGYGTTPIKAVKRGADYDARAQKSMMLIEKYHNKLEMHACVGCMGEHDSSCFQPEQLRLSLMKRRCNACCVKQQQQQQQKAEQDRRNALPVPPKFQEAEEKEEVISLTATAEIEKEQPNTQQPTAAAAPVEMEQEAKQQQQTAETAAPVEMKQEQEQQQQQQTVAEQTQTLNPIEQEQEQEDVEMEQTLTAMTPQKEILQPPTVAAAAAAVVDCPPEIEQEQAAITALEVVEDKPAIVVEEPTIVPTVPAAATAKLEEEPVVAIEQEPVVAIEQAKQAVISSEQEQQEEAVLPKPAATEDIEQEQQAPTEQTNIAEETSEQSALPVTTAAADIEAEAEEGVEVITV